MAKRHQSAVLNRLAGKKLVFNGKFNYGDEDSLKAIAEAQQGTVKDDLDAKVDYLVLADLSASKTIQKKALSLNSKGAAIQVIDADAFKKLAEPTEEEMVALLRASDSETFAKIHRTSYYGLMNQSAAYTFCAEDLHGVKLKNLQMPDVKFESCNFASAELVDVHIGEAPNCDFSKTTCQNSEFGDVAGSKFNKATIKDSHFNGPVSLTSSTVADPPAKASSATRYST
jgi:uncharacterized protein YjbI with pentapeptide repeats